jgi:serine/threonine protein kinase
MATSFRTCTWGRYVGPPVDMWALGAVIHVAIFGSTPFKAESVDSLIQKIQKGQFAERDSATEPVVSAECEAAMWSLLVHDPLTRCTAVGLASSSWLAKVPQPTNRLSMLTPRPGLLPPPQLRR